MTSVLTPPGRGRDRPCSRWMPDPAGDLRDSIYDHQELTDGPYDENASAFRLLAILPVSLEFELQNSRNARQTVETDVSSCAVPETV